MKNPNLAFAVSMLILISSLILTLDAKSKIIFVFKTIPNSKGCSYPTKEVKYIKTEYKNVLPFSQIHKCSYDHLHRLTRVRTYDFEKGYELNKPVQEVLYDGLKKPVQEVLYEWKNYHLIRYSIRKSTHGQGKIDAEVYKLN